MTTTMDRYARTFGDLRVALHMPPSRQQWVDVKAYLKRLHALSPTRVEVEALPYVEGIIARRWEHTERILWTDDAIWRFLEASPNSRFNRIFDHVLVRPCAHGRREIEHVLDSPLLSNVDHVTVEGHEHGAALLHRLLESKHLLRLRRLEFVRSELSGLSLASPASEAQIERLVFKRVSLRPDEVQKLCGVVKRYNIRQLELLCSAPLDLRSQQSLLDLPLEHLTLCNAGLTESGVLWARGGKRPAVACASLDVREFGERLYMPAERFRVSSRIR